MTPTIKDLPQVEVLAEYEIRYFGQFIPVIKAEDGHLYILLLSLCKAFDLNEIEEASRIQEHTVLKTMLVNATICGFTNLRCLRIGGMATWLLNLPLDRVSNPAIKEILTSFQQNAAQKLEEAFMAGSLTDAPQIAELLQHKTLAGNAYKEALATLGLARDQLMFEGEPVSSPCHYEKPSAPLHRLVIDYTRF